VGFSGCGGKRTEGRGFFFLKFIYSVNRN
jgi:hypothetical protein